MRIIGPLCSAAGLMTGFAAAGFVGQAAASVAAAAFFLLANLVRAECDDPRVLGLFCALVCVFLGYGLTDALSWAWRLWPAGQATDVRAMQLPLFFVCVTLFHAVEFLFTVVFHPSDIEFRAFLLTPVPAGGYSLAMVAALVEFWVERSLPGYWMPPWMATSLLLSGFLLAVGGWALRAAALFTAGSNFTHLVASRKGPSHELVTWGVYGWCRHPGYVGWFAWSVSTQLVLLNPVCLAAYAAVSWRFFEARIPGEEAYLLRFFENDYVEYARRVPCGIPRISRLRF